MKPRIEFSRRDDGSEEYKCTDGVRNGFGSTREYAYEAYKFMRITKSLGGFMDWDVFISINKKRYGDFIEAISKK